MKNLPKKLLSMCLVLTASSACLGRDLAPEDEGKFRPGEWTAVSDEQLSDLRGGFDASAGLSVSFGIVRTVMINGDLVARTSLHLPDVTSITAEQAHSVRAAIADIGLVQNGPGNSVDLGAVSQLPGSTLIQNSLNNQWIQTLTLINTSVNSLGFLNAINTQSALRDALMGSIVMR